MALATPSETWDGQRFRFVGLARLGAILQADGLKSSRTQCDLSVHNKCTDPFRIVKATLAPECVFLLHLALSRLGARDDDSTLRIDEALDSAFLVP